MIYLIIAGILVLIAVLGAFGVWESISPRLDTLLFRFTIGAFISLGIMALIHVIPVKG